MISKNESERYHFDIAIEVDAASLECNMMSFCNSTLKSLTKKWQGKWYSGLPILSILDYIHRYNVVSHELQLYSSTTVATSSSQEELNKGNEVSITRVSGGQQKTQTLELQRGTVSTQSSHELRKWRSQVNDISLNFSLSSFQKAIS